MPTYFILVDCNNFFVSCERLFQPRYNGKPVAVLSNNDGCFVSRSNEVKKLGIPMGAPLFKYRDEVRKHDVKLFSSNFSLYGDLSQRVMQVLSYFSEEMEIYSIDEAFLHLEIAEAFPGDASAQLERIGAKIRQTVMQWVGIPVSVGMANTKTLAKLANEIAKSQPGFDGVCALGVRNDGADDLLLSSIDVSDVWGVGRAYVKVLKRHQVMTALDLRQIDKNWIERRIGVMGMRMVAELNGEVCFRLNDGPVHQKSVLVSRTFARDVNDFLVIRQAVSRFVGMACERLRKQRLRAGYLTVFIAANRFKHPGNCWFSLGKKLDVSTAFTSELNTLVLELLKKIYLRGMLYKRAGVVFTDLTPDQAAQMNLFAGNAALSQTTTALMQDIDRLNRRFGSGMVGFASAGFADKVTTVQLLRSPRYTTRWDELLQIQI